ncbi:MAG TPA: ATP-dependent DNA helicase UvrD2 [Acidimicrobiales bacterium]|nr:ATP-dependent DNA helicase UvrD2 [Acidimicrobiales bacterium]
MTAAAGIACPYCGATHARAAEVRACWERSPAEVTRASDGAPVPDEDPFEPLSAPPAAGRLTGQPRAPLPPTTLGPALGRSVLVRPGATAPEAWTGCERVDGGALDRLEAAWRERRPIVIEVGSQPPTDEVEAGPLWTLGEGFSFSGERLAHALFSNAADAREGPPLWPLTERALTIGARPGGPADVLLPDGRPAYLDGGPLDWQLPSAEALVVPRCSLLAGSLLPLGENTTTAELAADQLEAVTHAGAAARIIAPAGSGKTRVLTERARQLLRRWNIPGAAVTLVAFNKRAADEMQLRTTDLPELRVRTLNALGLSLVSRSARVTTVDEREVRSILESLVDMPRRANSDPAAAWIEALSAVRLGLRDPAAVEADFGGDVDGLAEVFARYRALLADRRIVDFDEQIYRALEILLADPSARRAARAGCRMLLVDEFQDLTPAHLLLIRTLAGPEGAVFAVGDDDQTIYGYSGASPQWLIDYRSYFPGAGEHALEVNYRSPPSVVDAARTLLTHNRHRVEKRIVAAPARSPIAGEFAVLDGDPLGATLGRVRSLLADGAAPSEIAVLTRVNASLAPVQVALVHGGVPVDPAVGVAYLARSGVRAALSWLRLAVAPAARLSGADLAAAARRPSRGLSPRVAVWIGEQRGLRGIEGLAERLGARDGDKIRRFLADLEGARTRAERGTTAEILAFVRDELHLDGAMELLEGSRRNLDRSAHTDDLDALTALAELHPEPDGFEGWIRSALEAPGSSEGVMLSTVHAVKGREWPHVIVHEVSASLLPHRLAEDVEEERRIFHVGLTRGVSSVRVAAGVPPSPFIAELTRGWDPTRAVEPRERRPPRPERSRAGAPAASESEVAAAVGLEFERGGHRHVVTAVDESGVEVALGAARTRLSFGEAVIVAGRRVRLAAPPPRGDAVDALRQALRGWRSARASADGKPPYLYLHDRTLEALAAVAPTTMAGLAAIPGIGPGKLELYGEVWLALVSAAREGEAAGA